MIWKGLLKHFRPVGKATSDWAGLEWIFNERRTCACCDQPSASLLSYSYDRPGFFPEDIRVASDPADIQDPNSFVSSDLCVSAGDYAVRCILEIPFRDHQAVMTWGVWGSLSKENFKHYLTANESGTEEELGPMFSWLCNAVMFDDLPAAACTLNHQPHGLRPKLIVEDEEHPLFAMQQCGLSPEQITEFLRHRGHQI